MNGFWRGLHTLILLKNEVLILLELKLHLTLFSSCHCPIFLSHYIVAATRFLVNAPALRDGQDFTVMSPVRLDSMERVAC